MSEEAIAYGDEKNEQALAMGIKCRESGEYKPYNNDSTIEFNLDDLY